MGFLTVIATAVASLFGGKGSGPLIPSNIELDVDLWEKNQTLIVLLFLLGMAFIISRS